MEITSRLLLKVKAGAKKNSIDGTLEIDNKQYIKISIKAIPEKGRANKMILEFMAKELGVDKNNLEIGAGKTSQYKVLKLKKK
ncbi:DUF167 domain-containing protein [Rickettsiaceae bacterium]|nr:DUF167 domain-containing protein [Rickettsiaceae bacterium]